MQFLPALCLVLYLVSTTTALPTVQTRNTCTKFEVVTFDDLTPNPVTPAVSPIGTYRGLTYQPFNVAAASAVTGTNSGIVPQSPKNDATAALTTDTRQVGAVTLNPFGTISTATGTASFTLRSFYYGCSTVVLASSTVPAGALGCVITVIGFTTTGAQLSPVTYSFSPTSTVRANMAPGFLPATYTNLKNVTFGIAASGTVAADTVLQVDNLEICRT